MNAYQMGLFNLKCTVSTEFDGLRRKRVIIGA